MTPKAPKASLKERIKRVRDSALIYGLDNAGYRTVEIAQIGELKDEAPESVRGGVARRTQANKRKSK